MVTRDCVHLQLGRNACCRVAVIHNILHYVTARVWHHTPIKWHERTHATHTGCHLSLKWGRKQIWEKEAKIIQYMWCLFFFYVHFCSYLLTSEGKGEKQRKETNIYCLWLHQALFMRSQSVTLTVDIHLSLIAWLQIGGHLYKTVKSETKTTYSHVLYTLPELIDSSVYCISLCFIIWWNCAHVWCLLPQRPTSGCQYTLMYLVLYGHARNNHWQDNQRCVMFGLYLTLALYRNIVVPSQHKRIYDIVALHHYTLYHYVFGAIMAISIRRGKWMK